MAGTSNKIDDELRSDASPRTADVTEAQAPVQAAAVQTSFARRLAGATFHYGIGQSLSQVIRFLLIPVFTYVLTPADYGIIDMAAALSAFLVIFMRLGVPGAVTRFYFDHHEGEELRDYVTTVAWFLVLSSLAVGGLSLALGPWLIEQRLPGLSFYPYGLLVIVTAVIFAGQNLQDRLVQAREQSGYAAKLNLSRAFVSIACAVLFVAVFRWGATGMLLAEAVVATLFCIQAVRYLRRDLTGRFRWPMLKSSLGYAAGILPSHFIGNVAPLITRSVLATADSIAAVGLLGLATRFTQPLTILGFAFQNAYNPVYFSMRRETSAANLEKLAVTARTVWAGAIGCALGTAVLGPPTIVLMTPERFHSAADLLPILTIGFLGQALYTLLGPEIFYSKKTWLIPVVSAVSAAVTIGVTVATAETYGATGMAWAMSAGTCSSAVVAAAFSCALVRIPHQWGSLLRIAACGAAVTALGTYVVFANALVQFGYGLLVLLLFPALLWVTGDPTVRQVTVMLRARFGRSKATE